MASVFSNGRPSAGLPDTGRLRLTTGETPVPRAVEFNRTAEPHERPLQPPEQRSPNHCTPAIYVLQSPPSGGNVIGQRRAINNPGLPNELIVVQEKGGTMDKQQILRDSNFGERVAEEESTQLEYYFVETDQWARTYRGDVDVIYGPKGSGKSALYSLLVRRTNQLFDRGVMVVSAEKPRGTPVFKDLQQDPPTSEEEFTGLWKLYFLTLVSSVLREYDATSGSAKTVNRYLADGGLVQKERNLAQMLNSVFRYVRQYFRPPNSVEGKVHIDPATGLPTGFGGKISFTEPDSSVADVVSVDYLLSESDAALKELGCVLWVLLDRLDVAFAESPELEENALRALFRVYLDIMDLEHLCPKIFLRTDIWKRITSSGFREASHITRNITIRWDRNSLINLVVRRILKNLSIRDAYDIQTEDILSSIDNQFAFFYRVFPQQVDIGPNKSQTFDWLLARAADGTRETAPRELIHLLNAARDSQLRQHEIGSTEDEGDELFSRTALRDALPEVSRVRLQQTLYAEYPNLRDRIEALRGEKTLQHPASLSRIWGVASASATQIANTLVDVGFFEPRGTKADPQYWIPFLYRDATETVQGTAD